MCIEFACLNLPEPVFQKNANNDWVRSKSQDRQRQDKLCYVETLNMIDSFSSGKKSKQKISLLRNDATYDHQ